MKIAYIDKDFQPETLDTIADANAIIKSYQADGYDLTLRQLFYQFVARGLAKNSERSYKRLGSIINDARLAGWVDWNAIVDRTRSIQGLWYEEEPEYILRNAAEGYCVNPWDDQDCRPEVWIEKEALIGVIERVCWEMRVPYYACRGYNSQSAQWRAAQRVGRHIKDRKTPIIYYFGDHDPSGMDMPRDLADRFNLFVGHVEVKRLALNMDQVEEHNPPPNPAKISDSRATTYIAEFGPRSWELDALEPQVIADLVRASIDSVRNPEAWDESMAREEETRARMMAFADEWSD